MKKMQWLSEKYGREKVFLFLIMGAGFLFRIFYISYISVYDMQHDVGTPYEDYGHLGYIAYLMREGHLPDFDVRECFQFWHPPLHHGIAALFLKIFWTIFPRFQGNYEPLQILSLLYITVSVYVIYRLLKLWGISGKPLVITMTVMSFQPTFLILSGSVNNDALYVMLFFLAMWSAILWYKKPSYARIILCALSTGLGMAAKGNMAVIAVPLSFLFLMGIIRYKWKVIPQLFLFGLLSLPLGLAWYLRNYFLYDVPLNYIYRTSTDAIGYLGNTPVYKRILDFDPRRFSFQNIYVQFEGRFTEINPVTALLKSSVYGQQWFNYNIYIRIIAFPLVFIWIFYTVMAVSVLPSFVSLKRKGESGRAEQRIINISILILFFVQFISYYSFCLAYPYVWTMDIRYAVPVLLCHAILLGEFLKRKPKWEKPVLYITGLFVLFTVGCFTALSFTSFG